MKLKGLLIVVLLLVGATSAFAVDATLTVGQGFYTAGGKVTVPVVLTTNGNSISALALDVKYDPALLSAPVGTLGVAANTAKKALYTNVLPVDTEGKGTFRILIVGGMIESSSYPNGGIMTDKTDAGTSGLMTDGVVALVTFDVTGTATGNITLGSYVDASDPAAAQVLINGTADGITAGKVGDCYLDGKISLSDLTYAINIVIKKPGYTFNNRCDTNISNGVWNPDGKTTLGDITTLINILIKKPGWTLP